MKDNWEIINLGDAATFYNGYAFKPSDWSSTGKEIIRIQNLTKGSAQINYFNGSISDRYKVTKGDLLISWSATLGVYEWEDKDAWLNQHLFKVVFDKKEFDKNFFRYLITSSLQKMEEQVHGATMKHITKKKFDAFKIPLPPIAEQKKIAAILDTADAYRQKTKALIEKYNALSQSLFLEMFGDPVRNPMGWEKVKLGDVCENIQIGPFGSQLHKADYIQSGIPLINPTNVKNNVISFEKVVFISKTKYDSLPNYHLKKGDIIMARRGDLSKIGLVTKDDEQFCGTGSLFVRFGEKYNIKYIHRLLSDDTSIRFLEDNAQGVTMLNLNKSIVSKVPLMLPPLHLQNQFAQRIEAIEKQKAQAVASLAKAEDLFGSLLQGAFRGELSH